MNTFYNTLARRAVHKRDYINTLKQNRRNVPEVIKYKKLKIELTAQHSGCVMVINGMPPPPSSTHAHARVKHDYDINLPHR
jgi:hypothetical protein